MEIYLNTLLYLNTSMSNTELIPIPPLKTLQRNMFSSSPFYSNKCGTTKKSRHRFQLLCSATASIASPSSSLDHFFLCSLLNEHIAMIFVKATIILVFHNSLLICVFSPVRFLANLVFSLSLHFGGKFCYFLRCLSRLCMI